MYKRLFYGMLGLLVLFLIVLTLSIIDKNSFFIKLYSLGPIGALISAAHHYKRSKGEGNNENT